MDGNTRVDFFEHLHPICIFLYFVVMIGLVLVCMHPVMLVLACTGAFTLLTLTEGFGNTAKRLRFLLPMFLLIVIANPLFNHRGATRLFLLGDQWVTAEALTYGLTAALSLSALILWFGCYQKLMTSDKFLYLFGKAAPSSALLITIALGLIPGLTRRLGQIRDGQKTLETRTDEKFVRLRQAMRQISTLLDWSLESAVNQADSMKARGYGIRKRTTFHLFRYGSRDLMFTIIVGISGICCLAGRWMGYGTMEFYPRMLAKGSVQGQVAYAAVFAFLAMLPAILECGEKIKWHYYSLNL